MPAALPDGRPLRVLPPALIVNAEHDVLRDADYKHRGSSDSQSNPDFRKITRSLSLTTIAFMATRWSKPLKTLAPGSCQVLDLVQVVTYPFDCSAWFLIMIGRFVTLGSWIVCASHPCTIR